MQGAGGMGGGGGVDAGGMAGPASAGGAGGKDGGMGGGGGMGGMGSVDLTGGQGKYTAQKHNDEMSLLKALIAQSSGGGKQVTTGQSPGQGKTANWNPYQIQGQLSSFRGR